MRIPAIQLLGPSGDDAEHATTLDLNQPATQMRAAWVCPKPSPRVASVRLRCLQPMGELARAGIQAEFFDPRQAASYDAVIFSKAYDEKALRWARQVVEAGHRVILDLCDNHFSGAANDPLVEQRRQQFGAMLELASDVVVSTPTLAAQVLARFGQDNWRLHVIPDGLDHAVETAGQQSWADAWHMLRLKRFLRARAGALHLVWFGNDGPAHVPSGLIDLARIQPTLATFALEHPVSLTVIGGSQRRYAALAANWSVPSIFVPWSLGTIGAALWMHDVAVIPVGLNEFTSGKSINRPASAILAGLGVIADSIPAYEELRPYIVLDDWLEGLRRYAAHRPEERRRLLAARSHLRNAYARETIGARWRELLQPSRMTL